MATPAPDMTELTQQQAAVTKFNQELARLLGKAGNDPQSMIDLQVLINKRNEAYQRLAEMQHKLQQTLTGIINNMR